VIEQLGGRILRDDRCGVDDRRPRAVDARAGLVIQHIAYRFVFIVVSN